MRAIDADELYEKLDEIRKEEIALLSVYGVGNSIFCRALSIALIEINDAPTIKPERKKGKWKYIGFMVVECSECNTQFHGLECANFCPNCGAQMVGGHDD